MENLLPLQYGTLPHGPDNNLRLDTLIRVRWLAIAGQTLAVLIVAFVLDFPINMPVCMALIACSAWLNVFLGIFFRSNTRMKANWIVVLLAYDILQLSGLLFATGGLQNQFSFLLVVPVVVCSTIQTFRRTLVLAFLAICCATVLIFHHWELPWQENETLEIPLTYMFGMWTAIVLSIVFTAAYTFRVADEARKLSNALSATELVLQREQHLSKLDGLAAAAAHELGTPLATISLVSKELLRELPGDSPIMEDAELLKSQADRCRDILQKLSALSEEGDQHIGQFKISSMLEEVAEPHRYLGINIEQDMPEQDGEPVVVRFPGILYGLGNLVENAVDFASSTVVLATRWNDKTITVSVSDDGEGFPDEMLSRIGDPFVTTRPKNKESHGGGLGLGLFIAKTLLERSGASVEFSNAGGMARDKIAGARVVVSWPREVLLAQSQNLFPDAA